MPSCHSQLRHAQRLHHHLQQSRPRGEGEEAVVHCIRGHTHVQMQLQRGSTFNQIHHLVEVRDRFKGRVGNNAHHHDHEDVIVEHPISLRVSYKPNGQDKKYGRYR